MATHLSDPFYRACLRVSILSHVGKLKFTNIFLLRPRPCTAPHMHTYTQSWPLRLLYKFSFLLPRILLHYVLLMLNNLFPGGLFEVFTFGAAHQSGGAEKKKKEKNEKEKKERHLIV